MNLSLANKQVVLGVTGGIAAYKSADLVRRLREVGASVRVVMTESAKEFITPLTMQAVSGNPVHHDLFDLDAEAAMGHIELARWADVIVVAPATADFIARLAKGGANDLLTTLCLATQSPIVLAPAMNQAMWKNKQTQKNLQVLSAKKIHLVGPGEGSQACGDVGPGRMLEPLEILMGVSELFKNGLLAGKHVLITAGPTREALDPVRFLTNASSGKMGYALAEAAIEAGAKVTLISGPVNLPVPAHVTSVNVISTEEMFDEVISRVSEYDIFFSVAAVSDYRAKKIAIHKIKKTAKNLTLELERTPDIVASVAELKHKPLIVGFAAETEHLLKNAKAKLKNKKLDMIVANDVKTSVGSDENAVTVLWGNKKKKFLKMTKKKLARELIELISTTIQTST